MIALRSDNLKEISFYQFNVVVNEPLIHFHIDHPEVLSVVAGLPATFHGWCLHETSAIRKLVLKLNDFSYDLDYLKNRPDVKNAFPTFVNSGNCGFNSQLSFSRHGSYTISLQVYLDNDSTILVFPSTTELIVKENFYVRLTASIAENIVRYQLHRASLSHDSPDLTIVSSVNDTDKRFFINNIIDHCCPQGINVIGYIDYVIGISEVARMFLRFLMASDIAFCVKNITSPIHPCIDVEEKSDIQDFYSNELFFKKNLLFSNIDLLPILNNTYPGMLDDRENSQVYWWEFDTGFERHFKLFEFVDELIVFSDFIKDALQRHSCTKKITKLTLPFVLPDTASFPKKDDLRMHFNLPKNAYVFYYCFDYHSSFYRKNPTAIIAIFEKYVNHFDNAFLCFKTSNSQHYQVKKSLLEKQISDANLNDKVLIIDNILSRREMLWLMAASDCFVSLHRGEGLGLNMLDAMALSLPVVATAYGGNTEFMNKKNSYPVDYSFIPVFDDMAVYSDVEYWADPSLEQAGEIIHSLVENPQQGVTMGQKGKEFIKNMYSPLKCMQDLKLI